MGARGGGGVNLKTRNDIDSHVVITGVLTVAMATSYKVTNRVTPWVCAWFKLKLRN